MPTVPITPRDHNFSNDPIYLEIETALMSGTAPFTPDEDNLWCVVNVETTRIGDVVDEVMKFRLPYSRYNKRARLDLSGLITIPTEAPPNALLNTAPGILVTGVLDHVRRVNLTVADGYGIPLVEQDAVTVDEFNVVKGGTKYYQGFGDPGAEALLANCIDEYGKSIVKSIRRDQPDVLCFYVHEAKDIYINVQFYFKDGTVSGEWFVSLVSAVPNCVNVVQCGYNQLDMDSIMADLLIPVESVQYYKIIVGDLDVAVGAVNYVVYQLDDRDVKRDHYIGYFNGIGGVEIQRFSGKHRKSINAKSDLAIKPSNINIDWSNDPVMKTNASGHEVFTLNSGFISKGQADALGQMMLGDAWYVDNVRKRFYKIYIQAINMPVWDDEEELNSVEITYRTHDYIDYNRFNH